MTGGRWTLTKAEARQIQTGAPCRPTCQRSAGWHRRYGLTPCAAAKARHARSNNAAPRDNRDEAVRVPAGYVSPISWRWQPGTSILVPEIDPL